MKTAFSLLTLRSKYLVPPWPLIRAPRSLQAHGSLESDVGCHDRSLRGRLGDRQPRRRPSARERQGVSPPRSPRASSARDSGRSHFLLSGERCLAAPRARRVASTPGHRPAASLDESDREVTLEAREKAPLLVVASVLRARAPARSRSPTRSAQVRRRLSVQRTRWPSRNPADPPPLPEIGRASRPQVRRHGRAQRALPRHGASPSCAARRAAFADISAVSRLRAHTRKMPLRCRERWTHGAKLVAKLGAKLIAPTRATPRIAPLLRRPPSRARLTPDV